MKKVMCAVLCAAWMMMGFSACHNSPNETAQTIASPAPTAVQEESAPADTSTPADGALMTGLHHVQIDVQDYGTIQLELDADVAPITVTNFINLANSGFYNGLTFHRIISGFMIQGGDPNGDGTGGTDSPIKGEFSQNGVENNISHLRGVISMARAQDFDSASSQFFIVHADSTFLDGQYAAFGHVTEGMDVVDSICDTVAQGENGAVEKADQPVITSITVID